MKFWWLPVVAALTLSACGPGTNPAASEAPVKPVPPVDQSRHFPPANLQGTELVATKLLGKPFMPGGTLAHYRKGAASYDMFLAKAESPTKAAIAMLDWKNALTGAQFVASFGGYAGSDGATPVFVFAKGNWIAGVAGLPQKEADAQARVLAAGID